MSIRRTRETYAFINANPQPTTPLEALAHVVSIYEATDDARVMVQATHNVYDDGVTTGLTMGDLRALLREIDPDKAACILDDHDYDTDPEDISLHACTRPGCGKWYRD
jgi:hypothetical protein